MFVYRAILKLYSTKLYAPGVSGRWNSDGRKVIYCSESIALAFLENMIRRRGVGFNSDFKTMIIEIPEGIAISFVDLATLEDSWRSHYDYSKCQPIGNDWYDKGETAVLKVPSAILTDNFNYIINTTHSDYKKIHLVKTIDLIPDESIEELLKNYSK